ncbi:MAG TPA: DNA translocase FtsK 4TM domain-containing protein [Pirellulales bacterium]|jgi:S-DNA-T family DNA segregation ATPase FtsK/SpoIIIE
MPENRNIKRDMIALGLVALSVFLGLSLVSYDAGDPPAHLTYPPQTETHNVCGPLGARVSHALLESLGLGAYYLSISLGVVAFLLLSRRTPDLAWMRTLGWVVSLVGLTTLLAMAAPSLSPGPVAGSGGYLGAVGRTVLQTHLATAGAYLVVLSVLVCGLLLCSDYLVFRASAVVLGVPARAAGRGLSSVRGAMAKPEKPAAPRTDLGDAETRDMAVKIRGKAIDKVAAAEAIKDEEIVETDDAATAETDSGEEESDGQEDEAPASGLRIKPPAKRGERQEVMAALDAASRTEDTRPYELPSIDMLVEGEPIHFEEHEKDVRRKAKILEKTFLDFGFNVKVVEIETGPVIAQFEVELEAGLRLSKITGLADDLAIALRVPSVRIVAPIPGKNTVGIEVPNAERQTVRLREVIEEANDKASKMRIPIYLGKDVAGNPMVVDLTTLPHLLIAGRTGTGKSVCLNTLIVSMLMTRRPDEVRMLLIDPKMVEMSSYKTLPHLMHPVVTDMRKAEAILAWAVDKMEERYALLARAGVRHISGYNQLGEEELMERLQPENDEERKNIPTHLPYIVIVADEMADLMMTAAKEVETHIIRLAQKSRAVGIHLVLATQKPTVDVITGLIKSNLPARIAFQVASRTDSRVVLDEMGADKLLGNGDLLFLWPGTSTLIRGQGTYVGDDEINKIVEFVGTNEPEFVKELVQLKPAAPAEAEASAPRHRDDMYDAAVDVVIREGRGSVSLLQRSLGIGYGRAARLIDFMAEDGVVGTYNGSQAREVLITIEQWHAMNGDAVEKPEPPKARRNKVMPDPSQEDEPAPIPSGRARHSVVLNVEHSDADDEEVDEEEEGDEVTDDYEDEESAEDQLDDEAAEGEEAEVQPTKSRAAGRVAKPLAPQAAFDEENTGDDFEETDEAESEEDGHDSMDSDDDADSPPVRRFKAESA